MNRHGCPAPLSSFLHMRLQRLCQEYSAVDIRQHSAELKVTLAERLIRDADAIVPEHSHFFAIGICQYIRAIKRQARDKLNDPAATTRLERC